MHEHDSAVRNCAAPLFCRRAEAFWRTKPVTLGDNVLQAASGWDRGRSARLTLAEDELRLEPGEGNKMGGLTLSSLYSPCSFVMLMR